MSLSWYPGRRRRRKVKPLCRRGTWPLRASSWSVPLGIFSNNTLLAQQLASSFCQNTQEAPLFHWCQTDLFSPTFVWFVSVIRSTFLWSLSLSKCLRCTESTQRTLALLSVSVSEKSTKLLQCFPRCYSVDCVWCHQAAASQRSLFSLSLPQAESLEDKNMAKAHRCQLEKLKSQCEKLTEELAQNENENKRLKLKYQCLKDQLEEKVKAEKEGFPFEGLIS